MTYFPAGVRKLGPVPPALLAALETKIEGSPEIWSLPQDATEVGRNPALKQSTDTVAFAAPVRDPDGMTKDHRKCFYDGIWPEWKGVIEPIIQHAAAHLGYESYRTTRITLNRMHARDKMALHIDFDPASQVPHKIHVPIVTDPAVNYLVKDEAHHLSKGFAWEVNNRVMHGGENPSSQPRTHLIFEIWQTPGRAPITRFSRFRRVPECEVTLDEFLATIVDDWSPPPGPDLLARGLWDTLGRDEILVEELAGPIRKALGVWRLRTKARQLSAYYTAVHVLDALAQQGVVEHFPAEGVEPMIG